MQEQRASAGWPRTRVVAIDGAVLAFDRKTGQRCLVRSSATRALRASAPPLVLFSASNACNLACGFCYRDADARSVWTEASATALLSALAARGTLEVAFGGGEPFALRGFASIVESLTDHTPLVVHATTNGTLVTDALARRLRGRIGELRLSVYDDTPWRDRLALLQQHGHEVGLHYLVTPERLPRVRAFVEEAIERGARKVFLLSYHGDDRALRLSREEHRSLAQTIGSLSDLPIEVGLSACWGERLEMVPRLDVDRGGDCGAGSHFVSISADGALSPCSFHHQRRGVRTADDVIDAWNAMRAPGPARAPGCGRPSLVAPPPDGAFSWRAWSGNNSVDCVVVGRFGSAGAAADAVSEIRALTTSAERTLLDQAWAALDAGDRALREQLRDPKAFAAALAEQRPAREAWLSEVASWERGPTAVERYASALGAVEGAPSLPVSVEVPEQLLSFGSTAIYAQGTTLQPFRALEWLWTFRGARMLDTRGSSSNRLQLLWATRCETDADARRVAIDLEGVARERAVFGLRSLGDARWNGARWERIRSVELLQLELDARGLAYDGRVIEQARPDAARFERVVAALRKKPPLAPMRLTFTAPMEAGELIERELDALARDPSNLSEWSGRRVEGSRRWPRDFQQFRFGALHVLQGEHLPIALGRGLLVRGASIPYALEARDVRVAVALFGDEPAKRASATLRSLGLRVDERESPRRGTLVTREPIAVLDRVCKLTDRAELGWNTQLAPADPLVEAVEALQRALSIAFER